MGNVVVALGDINIDICMIGSGRPEVGRETLAKDMVVSPAGSTGYFAFAIARLGEECRFVGRLGGDYFGKMILDKMKSFGIQTGYIKVDPDAATGVTVSVVMDNGERVLVSYLGPTELLSIGDVDERALKGAKTSSHGCFPASEVSSKVSSRDLHESQEDGHVDIVGHRMGSNRPLGCGRDSSMGRRFLAQRRGNHCHDRWEEDY